MPHCLRVNGLGVHLLDSWVSVVLSMGILKVM